MAEYDQGRPWRNEIERDLPGFLVKYGRRIGELKSGFVERLAAASPRAADLGPDDHWEIAVKLYVLLVVQSISTETENWAQIQEVEVSKWLWCEQAKTTMTLEEAMARWSRDVRRGMARQEGAPDLLRVPPPAGAPPSSP